MAQKIRSEISIKTVVSVSTHKRIHLILLNMTSKFLYVISHCFSHNRSNYHNTSALPNKAKQDEKHEIKIQIKPLHIDAQKKLPTNQTNRKKQTNKKKSNRCSCDEIQLQC